MIPEKYLDLGFEISTFGEKSLALKRKNKVIFVFSPGSEIKDEFVGILCDCHLKMCRQKESKAEGVGIK